MHSASPVTSGEGSTFHASDEVNQLQDGCALEIILTRDRSGCGGSPASASPPSCGGLENNSGVIVETSCSTENVFSPSKRLKGPVFVGGYVHSMPRILHLRQCGVCFSHLRFAIAHELHAFVSKLRGMLATGIKHNVEEAEMLTMSLFSPCGRYPD